MFSFLFFGCAVEIADRARIRCVSVFSSCTFPNAQEWHPAIFGYQFESGLVLDAAKILYTIFITSGLSSNYLLPTRKWHLFVESSKIFVKIKKCLLLMSKRNVKRTCDILRVQTILFQCDDET